MIKYFEPSEPYLSIVPIAVSASILAFSRLISASLALAKVNSLYISIKLALAWRNFVCSALYKIYALAVLAKLPAINTFSTVSCICSTPGILSVKACTTLCVSSFNCSPEKVSSIDSKLAFLIASAIFCALNCTISPVRFFILVIILANTPSIS